MKRFLIRLSIYIPIITIFYWLLTPHAFDPIPFQGPLIAQLPGYIVYYGGIYGIWILIYEGCYRLSRYFNRRVGEQITPIETYLSNSPQDDDIPDTQPLSAIQHANNPTRPIDKP